MCIFSLYQLTFRRYIKYFVYVPLAHNELGSNNIFFLVIFLIVSRKIMLSPFSTVRLTYHCQSVYTKIWKESHRDLEAPRNVSSRDQSRADQKQLIQMENLGIGFLRTVLADDDRGYARRQDENVLDSKKGKN